MIDNGMPVVIMRADALGLSGYETIPDLQNNAGLTDLIENIRQEAIGHMNLDRTRATTIPKMIIVSSSTQGHLVNTRTFNKFNPAAVMDALGVNMGYGVATAALFDGTVVYNIANMPMGDEKEFVIGHPTGSLTIEGRITGDSSRPIEFIATSTARKLVEGTAFF